jgi:hypothetical protein
VSSWGLLHAVKDTLNLFGNLIDLDIHPVARPTKMQHSGLPGVGNDVDTNLTAIWAISDGVDGETHTIASNGALLADVGC